MGGAVRCFLVLERVVVVGFVCALVQSGCSADHVTGRSPKRGATTQSSTTKSKSGTSSGAADAGGGSGFAFGNADGQVTENPSTADGAVRDGGGTVKAPDMNGCGSVELDPMVNTVVAPGNLLVVFDNSGSMESPWDSTTRWQAAGNAVRDAVSSIAEFVTVGAIIFPSGASSCNVDPITSSTQIRFVPGAAFVAAWDNFLAKNMANGGTPLGEALTVADTSITAANLKGNTRVVVLTDGEPNCDNSALMTVPPMWLTKGIKTYVVGLPGSESAVTTLDALATAGGTMQHLTPSDSRTLRHQLANILTESVTSALPSCSIPLTPPAPNPMDVHVVVTEQGERKDAARDLGKGGGWMIKDDGSQIDLFGPFCDQGIAGAYTRISIEYGCLDLPPLPPPPPVVVQ